MCIFCEISAGRAPCHKIWEDEDHLAILSIFPNTEGFSVVFPKKHRPSYAFGLNDEDFSKLALAAKKVGLILDSALDDVGRTALIFEGYGVDHVHAKLFPMHGTPKKGPWKKISSSMDKYFHRYEGYVSSHDHARADDADLGKLAAYIVEKTRHHAARIEPSALP